MRCNKRAFNKHTRSDFSTRTRCEGYTHPLLGGGVLLQGVEGVLHPGQPAGQGQQQAHHLVQIPYKHPELVQLVGFAHLLDLGLHLVSQGVVVQDVLLETLAGLAQHLQLLAEAVNQLLLHRIREKTNSSLRDGLLCRLV